MLRVAAGDERAFETLVGLMLPRLIGFFRRMGADASFAEDCAQEVFLKVYRARQSYVARARFTTYLFHIARNHWIDIYRQRRSAPPTHSVDQAPPGQDGDSPAGNLPGRDREAGALSEDSELGRAIREAVDALGTEHRDVFVLAQVEGLKYQEIGQILGIPVGTVKSRMHAAVRQIRRRLESRGFEP